MRSFLVVGGVGDQLYQLLSIAHLNDSEAPIVCVAQRDEAKARYIAQIISEREDSAGAFNRDSFNVLKDEDVLELIDFCQAHKKQGDITGGFTAYLPSHGLVTCLWPDLSSDLSALFEASACWVNLYENFSGARICCRLDRAYKHVYEKDAAIAAISSAKRVFASPNANSVPIDMRQLNELVGGLKNPVWEVVKVHSNEGNARRLDIKSKSDQSPLSKSFAAAMTRQGFDAQIIGGNLSTLHAEIAESDLVLTVRSGLTDLAYFTGRSLLTYYPSMEIYRSYRMSRREVILEELRGGGVCTALISNQVNLE